MLRKRNARKALCLLIAVCLTATGFSMAVPAESYGADNTQGQYLGTIDVQATVESRYGESSTYDEDLYDEIIGDGYDDAYKTKEHALKIEDAADLAAFAKAVNEGRDFSGKYVKLTADINLGGTEPTITKSTADSGEFNITITGDLENVWTPIGTKAHPFEGTFDGDGKTITGLVVCETGDSTLYAGFFGYTEYGSTINNLGIGPAYVIANKVGSSPAYAGALVGYYSNGSITSCHASGETYANGSTEAYAGALVGYNSGGSIESSHASGETYAYSGAKTNAGGLAGFSSGRIDGCHASGDAYANGHNMVDTGALVGSNYSGSIKNCHASGETYANGSTADAGALVGINDNGSIDDCHASGDAYAYGGIANAGALVGCYINGSIESNYASGDAYANGSTGANAGALVGYYSNGSITSCHASGDAYANGSTEANAGALVGYCSGSIDGCYGSGGAYAYGHNQTRAGGLVGYSHRLSVINRSYRNSEASVTAIKDGGPGTINTDGVPLTRQEMTGTGKGRASEKMTDLGNDWIFTEDGPLQADSENPYQICYFPILKAITYTEDSKPTYKRFTNAQNPVITRDLDKQNATYVLGTDAAALKIKAEVEDGGKLEYQWYQNDHNGTDGGTELDGEDGTSYTPPTDTAGTKYYYCIVTNQNASASGDKSAASTSKAAEITIHEHIFSSSWSSNSTHHWRECDPDCPTSEKGDYEAHSWDAGEVTKEPTYTSPGVKRATCTVCGKTKTESVPALADPGSYYCTLTADALAFPDLQAGDTPQSQSLQLRCSGNTGATITKIELSSADFLLDDSKAEACVGAGKTNSTYQITPKAGLSPGSYKAKVIVTYGYGRIAEASITLTVTKARQEAPAKLTAKSKSCRTVALSWKKAERAEKYQVYRATKKSGAYKRISTTSKTALNNIRLTTGKTYYYKVRAYRTVNGKKVYSPFTGIASAKPKPAAPSFSLKAGKGRITASWKSVSGATGYQIYRASAKNGKFALVKDSRGKARSYTNTKLRSGKTYYYKMCAYRVVSGKKIYSSYTKVKNIKTK